MAKISGINTNLRGQIGEYLFRKTKYGTIVSEAPSKRGTPVRTEGQMYIRTQWVNLGAIYRQFNKTLKKAYEGLGNTMSVYNAFVQANINVVKVFITKRVKANGGSVLAPYQITRGTLPSIGYVKDANDVLVTDLSLGSLQIDAQTEGGALAEAIVANNAEWEAGDQLTFFYGRQTVDSVTGTPRAMIVGTKVVLDVTDSTPLWNITGSLGFSSVSVGQDSVFMLGMNRSIVDGAAAWVHSRESQGSDDMRVGTQSLFVDSSVLAQWQGDAAFDASAESYGGINSESVFLDPKAIRKRGVSRQTASPVEWGTANGGGSNGSSGSSGGSQTDSGSVTPTVGTPTISGQTSFNISTEVSMSAESGAEIHYTTDGSTPTADSTLYSAPFTLNSTTTVKAIAIKDGVSSAVASKSFTKSSGSNDD